MRKIFKVVSNLLKFQLASCAMGHLELNGFRAHRGHVMEEGMDCDDYLRSSSGQCFQDTTIHGADDGKIFYLGNPYEMFWNDVNDPRGFTIFDTKTLEHDSRSIILSDCFITSITTILHIKLLIPESMLIRL